MMKKKLLGLRQKGLWILLYEKTIIKFKEELGKAH